MNALDMGMDVSPGARTRRWFALVALTATALTLVGLAGSPAAAQAPPPCNDPYGCPPIIDPGSLPPECPTLAPSQGAVGTTVTATVTGVDPPNATVTILFDGSPVGSGTAAGGTAQVSFNVPAATTGPHTVTAVAPNGSVTCGTGFTVVSGTGTPRSGGPGSGGGSLARTGFTVLGLLLLAALLVLVGRAMVESSRRSRRHRSA